MSAHRKLWKTLASELEDALRRDLGSAQASAISKTPQRPRAIRTRGAVVRTGGSIGKPSPLARRRMQHVPIVVVEVPEEGKPPSELRVKRKLKLDGPIDLYCVIVWKHWAALESRELNPEDRDRGREHSLILRNLKPDYALVVSAESPPEWSRAARDVIAW